MYLKEGCLIYVRNETDANIAQILVTNGLVTDQNSHEMGPFFHCKTMKVCLYPMQVDIQFDVKYWEREL